MKGSGYALSRKPPAAPDRGEGTEPVDITTPIWRKPHVIGYWLPPVLWGLAVLFMSGNVGSATNTRNLLQGLLSWFVTVEPAQIDLINFYLRKTGHVLAYGFMYFLWFRAFREHGEYGPGRSCLWSLGFCLLYSSMDEGRQWFFPSRTANIGDVILDMSGSSLAALVTFAVWTPRDLAAPIPIVIWWQKPHVLSYWLPPVLWSLAGLAVLRGLVPVEITLGPLRWFLSWFAWVDSYDLKILNLYLWKTGQAVSFGILYVLWFRAFQKDAGARRGRACLYALGLCILVAMMHETLQAFARTRGGSMYEVILDMSGASLAALITAAVWRPRNLAAPIPIVIWWQKPDVLSYWLPPVLWSLAGLAVLRGLVPVEITLGPLRWFVSWFAWVDSYDLKILNLYLWKTGQAVAFGILYVLWFRAFQKDAGARRGRACLYALGLCILVAMMRETLQAFARTRGGSMYEVILDMSGASLAALVTFAVWTPRDHAGPRMTR